MPHAQDSLKQTLYDDDDDLSSRTAAYVESRNITSHGDLSYHGGNCRVDSSRVESSHITWRPLVSLRKLSSRFESHHITWRPLVSRRKLSSRFESHHITWRPLVSRRKLSRRGEAHHMVTSRIIWRKLSSRVESHHITWRPTSRITAETVE
jgi:hypothetical protein